MKFWQMLTWCEPEQMVELARIAEDCGFEGVMTADHAFFPQQLRADYPYSEDGMPPLDETSYYPDVFVSTMAMAAATTRLKFSCAVYVLPIRHPVEVAKASAALALFSADRFVLGAGLGWMREEYEVYGVDWRGRGRRADEYLAILRRLWAGGWVEHHGEAFDFDPLTIKPAAPQGVPIFWGGASKPALRRAAASCEGWIGAGNTVAETPALLADLKQFRDQAGMPWDGFETVIGLSDGNDVEALKLLEEQGMTAGVSPPYRFVLGDSSSLDAKRAMMERFAEEFIRPLA
jgi:probable F420-dependent oxidoreductase